MLSRFFYFRLNSGARFSKQAAGPPQRLIARTASPKRQFAAEFFLAGSGVHFNCDSQIPRRNAVGLEQRDFRIARAPADFAGNHIAKLAAASPADFGVLDSLAQVALSLPR